MKKKVLSLALALCLCMGLAVPAMAAPAEFVAERFDEENRFTLSDVVSQEKISCVIWDMGSGDYKELEEGGTLYTVRVGTTMKFEFGDFFNGAGTYVIHGAYVDENGKYNESEDEIKYNEKLGKDVPNYFQIDDQSGTLEFTEEYVGTWLIMNGYFVKVIGGDAPVSAETTTQPAAPDAPGSYTAKKGDTWSTICTNFYGTNAQRYALIKANKGVKLKEGAVITLPGKLGKDVLLPAPMAGEGEKLYTVKAGDTLGKIALAEYGKMSAYKAIYERNADRLKNADTIYEGQVIVLPASK